MRVVVQRVRNAEVNVPDTGYNASIGHGLLLLAAFIDEDTDEDLDWTARKIAAIFLAVQSKSSSVSSSIKAARSKRP